MKLVLKTFLYLSMTSCTSVGQNMEAKPCPQRSVQAEIACVVDAELNYGSESYFVVTVGSQRRVVSVSEGSTNEIISLPAVDYSDARLILLQGGGTNGGDILVLEDHYYETEPGDIVYQWQLIDMPLKREFGIISASGRPMAKPHAHAWLISTTQERAGAGASGIMTVQKYYCIQEGSLNAKDSATCQ